MATKLYSTIEYSPGWYYKKWPGFYNEECYKILSEYSHHPERFDPTFEAMEEGVEETKGEDPQETEDPLAEDQPVLKKIKIEENTV
jgi:hypothetical protein